MNTLQVRAESSFGLTDLGGGVVLDEHDSHKQATSGRVIEEDRATPDLNHLFGIVANGTIKQADQTTHT